LLVELSDALAEDLALLLAGGLVERAGLLSLLATGLRARRRLRSRTVGSGQLEGLRAGPGWPHADTRDGLAMVRDDAGVFFLVLHDGAVIGDCGTHGAPDAQGSVEIGFGLAAPSGVAATAVSWPRPSRLGQRPARVREVTAEPWSRTWRHNGYSKQRLRAGERNRGQGRRGRTGR